MNLLLFLVLVPYAIVLSWMDVRTRRLPNWLTVGGAVVALLFRLGWGGWGFFLDGFAAATAAGAFMLLPFLARGAGGGDVKMLFAAGAVVGWSRVLSLLGFMSLAGLVLGIAMILTGRLDNRRLKHAVRSVFDWRYDRKTGAANLPPRESDAVRIPFSIAIAVGMLAAMVLS